MYKASFVISLIAMASIPQHIYELAKLADKLNKDYYPVTEVLCKNAMVQAEWLHNNDAGEPAMIYMSLCNELNTKVRHHIALTRDMIHYIRTKQDDSHSESGTSVPNLRTSQASIKNTLHIIKEETALIKIMQWPEMQQDIQMQLRVISNVLNEVFSIEDSHIIPLLENER